MCSGALEPLIASVRIGSATGLACAAAIGAAPRMINAMAPAETTVGKLAVMTHCRRAAAAPGPAR